MRNASWIVLLSLASSPLLAQQKTIEPGLYEVVTRSTKGPADTTRVCLDAKDITKGLSPEVDKNCKRDRSVVADGKLDPHVEDVRPLDEAADAVAAVEIGHARGKVVVQVS